MSLTATADAKPQATVVVQKGDATKYAGTRLKSDFLSPEPDEDFVDPEEEYRIPWEKSDVETGSDHLATRQENESFAAS